MKSNKKLTILGVVGSLMYINLTPIVYASTGSNIKTPLVGRNVIIEKVFKTTAVSEVMRVNNSQPDKCFYNLISSTNGKALGQFEPNTVSVSFSGASCVVKSSDRTLLVLPELDSPVGDLKSSTKQ